MRRSWLLFNVFALAATLPAIAFSEPLKVQVVHGRNIEPMRHVEAAVGMFAAAGIEVEIVRIVRRRLPRLRALGTAPINQMWPIHAKHRLPGVRTLVIAAPKVGEFGRPLLSGVGLVCGELAVVGWAVPRFAASTIAHELGHTFGATHKAGRNVMNPAPDDFTAVLPETVQEVRRCKFPTR